MNCHRWLEVGPDPQRTVHRRDTSVSYTISPHTYEGWRHQDIWPSMSREVKPTSSVNTMGMAGPSLHRPSDPMDSKSWHPQRMDPPKRPLDLLSSPEHLRYRLL